MKTKGNALVLLVEWNCDLDRGCHRKPLSTKEKQLAATGRDELLFLSRGDRTPLELFIAGVRGWEAYLRRRLDDGKPVERVT